MVRNRRGLAPWSLAREAGIESATVDGTIEVPQYVQPVLDTGFVDEDGNWKGSKSSDEEFGFYDKAEAIANGASFITAFKLDMTGFCDLQVAIKPTNGGTYGIKAIMGSSGPEKYANLSPLNDGGTLRYARDSIATFENLFDDSNETLVADVWNIFMIMRRCQHQKLLQFSITNSSGDISTVETTFMRLL